VLILLGFMKNQLGMGPGMKTPAKTISKSNEKNKTTL